MSKNISHEHITMISIIAIVGIVAIISMVNMNGTKKTLNGEDTTGFAMKSKTGVPISYPKVNGEICESGEECITGWCTKICNGSWMDPRPTVCSNPCPDGCVTDDGARCLPDYGTTCENTEDCGPALFCTETCSGEPPKVCGMPCEEDECVLNTGRKCLKKSSTFGEV